MEWQSLYTRKRTGDAKDKIANPDTLRTSFVRDYDRIIFSSAFRRLQNKTQVFPLPGPVFVHNRLTHSLEVASVGRSLGTQAGYLISKKYAQEDENFHEFYRHELAYVIAAACLAHDIGNPPFGHSGEDAIRHFFRNLHGEQKDCFEKYLSEAQKKDFILFEGNANALRTLTNNFNEAEDGGYKLTYTSLAALIKYPCSSREGFGKGEKACLFNKKSGFFCSEKELFLNIARQFRMPQITGNAEVYARHPFVYLTEAADDICYRIIDLEDAHRIGIAPYETIASLFLPFFEDAQENDFNSLAHIKGKLDSLLDNNQKVQFIRAKWIGLMISRLSRIFMDNEEALLAGTLDSDLLSLLPPQQQELIKAINTYSEKQVYNYNPVVEIEIAGFNVIGRLLKEFTEALVNPTTKKSKKLLTLISPQFPIAAGNEALFYQNLMSIVDFISGMTDLYAIDLYRKITGIAIPQIA